MQLLEIGEGEAIAYNPPSFLDLRQWKICLLITKLWESDQFYDLNGDQ